MTNLYKIKDKQGRLQTFKPNYVQLLHLAERRNHKRNRILKYRQGGITTLYCIDLLDEALWVAGMSCAILAHERQALTKIFEIVKRAYENIPDAIKPLTRTDTKNEYNFTHRYDGAIMDSSIYVAMKVRSGTVRKLHITESAYIKDRQELIAGSMQAVPLDGSITEETTGNGFNEFYDAFMEGWNNPSPSPLEYRSYFYAWWQHPEYTLPGSIDEETLDQKEREGRKLYGWTDGQILWRRWKKQELRKSTVGAGLTGDQLFMQEYPSNIMEAFQSGSGMVFSAEKLNDTVAKKPLMLTQLWQMVDKDKEQAEREGRPPLYADAVKDSVKHLYNLGFWFWDLPKVGREYVIGCDPSDGEGSDNSDIDVLDKDTGEQVCQYYGKVRPDELAEYLAEAGKFFNEALIGVENNMLTTILFLSKIYSNYYFETKQDEKTLKRTKKIGWNTNSKTRDLMIDEFVIAWEEEAVTVRSQVTLGEMKTFVKNESGKREHAAGKHDDSLFGIFIANQMRKFGTRKAKVYSASDF